MAEKLRIELTKDMYSNPIEISDSDEQVKDDLGMDKKKASFAKQSTTEMPALVSNQSSQIQQQPGCSNWETSGPTNKILVLTDMSKRDNRSPWKFSLPQKPKLQCRNYDRRGNESFDPLVKKIDQDQVIRGLKREIDRLNSDVHRLTQQQQRATQELQGIVNTPPAQQNRRKRKRKRRARPISDKKAQPEKIQCTQIKEIHSNPIEVKDTEEQVKDNLGIDENIEIIEITDDSMDDCEDIYGAQYGPDGELQIKPISSDDGEREDSEEDSPEGQEPTDEDSDDTRYSYGFNPKRVATAEPEDVKPDISKIQIVNSNTNDEDDDYEELALLLLTMCPDD